MSEPLEKTKEKTDDGFPTFLESQPPAEGFVEEKAPAEPEKKPAEDTAAASPPADASPPAAQTPTVEELQADLKAANAKLSRVSSREEGLKKSVDEMNERIERLDPLFKKMQEEAVAPAPTVPDRDAEPIAYNTHVVEETAETVKALKEKSDQEAKAAAQAEKLRDFATRGQQSEAAFLAEHDDYNPIVDAYKNDWGRHALAMGKTEAEAAKVAEAAGLQLALEAEQKGVDIATYVYEQSRDRLGKLGYDLSALTATAEDGKNGDGQPPADPDSAKKLADLAAKERQAGGGLNEVSTAADVKAPVGLRAAIKKMDADSYSTLLTKLERKYRMSTFEVEKGIEQGSITENDL